ncbi:MAG: LacI family transcriptional regulator [Calditrichaeota bacterium]|nr:MAG: LacI family transcriptional regulator [Calditrichota bacterium]
MPNLKDVARLAGVSIATVSRVLNGAKNVNPETRLKVEQAVQQLNFQPNRVARRLRAKRVQSNLIGVLIPDIQNPFYVEVVHGIDLATTEMSYAFLMSNFSQSEEKERFYLDIMLSESVDGLIVAPAHEEDAKVKAIVKSGLPVVCIDRVLRGVNVDAVVVNNRQGAYDAIQYLVQLGHRRIAFICGPLKIPTYRERLNGYREALEENGIAYDEALVRFCDSTLEAGKRIARELLELSPPPTALFTGNNLLTLGALEVLHRQNMRIPRDISILGFDDMYWSISLNPPLTAVSQPGFEIGRRAAEMLFQRINEPGRPTAQIVLNTRLMVRSSCGAPSGN